MTNSTEFEKQFRAAFERGEPVTTLFAMAGGEDRKKAPSTPAQDRAVRLLREAWETRGKDEASFWFFEGCLRMLSAATGQDADELLRVIDREEGSS